jgi:hypothetical protein
LDIDARLGLAVSGPKREVAHLSLDAAEIAAVAAGHDALLKNLVEHGFMKCIPLPWGE